MLREANDDSRATNKKLHATHTENSYDKMRVRESRSEGRGAEEQAADEE